MPEPTLANAVLNYQSGFGNEFATEAVPGALPLGRNSPQRVAHGLYAEGISGTPFTAPRGQNRRTWTYRIRPSAMQPAMVRIDNGLLRSAPMTEADATPNRLRWDPLPIPTLACDFIDGLTTVCGGGDVAANSGYAIHMYLANRSMDRRYFYNADGEMLIVPQQGRLMLFTELGKMGLAPGEIGVIPRGIKYKVDLLDGPSRGYICENYGALLRLPELGPIGSNGLANPRDFLTPVAAFEDFEDSIRLVAKFQGNLWTCDLAHSPLDVVAWHGNHVPYKYDLDNFMVIGSVSFDHPDPSIFTVLTSPTDTPGTANVDFVIFPPRWAVAENTFRPPWFHRNYMNEFMGLIKGTYDAKAEGFTPGGASLHNCMSAHGPDVSTFDNASAADLVPRKIEGTMAFMFETKFVCRPTRFAMDSPVRQADYDACWNDFGRHFPGSK